METVREEHPLAHHPLEACLELDFRDGERMSEMERAIGVGEGDVAEPLGVLFLDIRLRQTCELLLWRGIDLKDALLRPPRLVLPLEFADFVAFASLSKLDGVGGGHGADTR